MLISKKIAEDQKFLTQVNGYPNRRDQAFFINLRVKIMLATKVVVGAEFLDLTEGSTSTYDTFSDGTPVGLQKDKATEEDMRRQEKVLDKRLALYVKYCRLPFTSVVFENAYGLHLVEKVGNLSFKYHIIGSDGRVEPYTVTVNLDDHVMGKNVQSSMTPIYEKDLMNIVMSDPIELEEMKGHVGACTFKLLDTLLHFNVANSRVHVYRPSKSELKKVPPAMEPNYVYRIVDVFRERTVYHTLADVERVASEEASLRKAHLVKGHFKEIKGALYWWNPFVRCRNNVKTAGAVIKDYALH